MPFSADHCPLQTLQQIPFPETLHAVFKNYGDTIDLQNYCLSLLPFSAKISESLINRAIICHLVNITLLSDNWYAFKPVFTADI